MIDEDHKLQHLTNFFFPRMYDVDGNGVIDQEEMTKIVQVKPTYNTIPCPTKSTPKYCKKYCCLPWKHCKLRFKLSPVENTNKSIGPHCKQSLNKFFGMGKRWQHPFEMLRNAGDLWHAGRRGREADGHCRGESQEYLQQVKKDCRHRNNGKVQRYPLRQ